MYLIQGRLYKQILYIDICSLSVKLSFLIKWNSQFKQLSCELQYLAIPGYMAPWRQPWRKTCEGSGCQNFSTVL
jgi:hypothetical protein